MSKWLIGLCAILVGGAMVLGDAEAARRLGGGRAATGTQRSITNAPPAQQKAAPAQSQQQQGAAAQQQPGSRWGGILGGLALGGLLGYLLGGSGLGGALVGMLLLGLLVFGAVVVFRMLAQRREAPQPMQYAGAAPQRGAPMPAVHAMAPTGGAAVQAGFDANGFLKGAKLNFIKLQAANDAGQIEDIREFTTDEMFGELKRDMEQRAGATQRTDVVSLDADLLEIVTEGDRHWASVRFSGTIREDAGGPEGFEEVWNLVKPADGSSGWLLAGIQQMH
jgi:predicted lipid-binding transport protein (Tim44 family)